MEIKIYKKDHDDMIEQNKIRWRLYMQKSVFTIRIFFILGSVILLLTWLALKKDANFWRFESSFGLSILLLSVFYSYHNFINKRKYLARTKELINKYRDQSVEMNIRETAISYKGFEMSSEMKWSVFSQYKLDKTYLVLIIDNITLNSILIDQRDISEAEFTQLFEFVKTILKERE